MPKRLTTVVVVGLPLHPLTLEEVISTAERHIHNDNVAVTDWYSFRSACREKRVVVELYRYLPYVC